MVQSYGSLYIDGRAFSDTYSPDKTEEAIELVLQQAEVLSNAWSAN